MVQRYPSKISAALFSLLAMMMIGCSHAPKTAQKTDATPSVMAPEDSSIQNADINFDPLGSDSGKIDGLTTVHFDFDKSDLSADVKQTLQRNAAWLTAHPGENLELQGNCDRFGSQEYNLGLGDRRANAVKAYLVSLGVPRERLSTISYGKERMLDKRETLAADKANRRVNFNPTLTMQHASRSVSPAVAAIH